MSSGPRRVLSGLMTSVVLAAAGCTTGPAKQTTDAAAGISDETTSQPSTATYNCADGGIITIENLGAYVRISGVSDDAIELPASPASQRSRYGQQPYALVLEGRDALFMKSGAEPLTCTR
jgi:hypothetical protein